MDQPYLSIIIPVLNEQLLLAGLLEFLTIPKREGVEIIIVDGGSTDQTKTIVLSFPVRFIECGQANRANQMNIGASESTGEILYFLHADAMPPGSFFYDIHRHIEQGYDMGSYRLHLGSTKNHILALNSYLTRIGWLIFQGGGDQSLFIKRTSFDQVGGYDPHYVIMEDFDFIRRARSKKLKWLVMNQSIQVSDRKYNANNYALVQLANLLAFSAFKLGVAPIKIKAMYHYLLK
jgi:rSAM/selenodomain-associated transferase 2